MIAGVAFFETFTVYTPTWFVEDKEKVVHPTYYLKPIKLNSTVPEILPTKTREKSS